MSTFKPTNKGPAIQHKTRLIKNSKILAQKIVFDPLMLLSNMHETPLEQSCNWYS